jgi:hypothetical protein
MHVFAGRSRQILSIIVTVSSDSFVSQNPIDVLASAIVFSLSSYFGGATPEQINTDMLAFFKTEEKESRA